MLQWYYRRQINEENGSETVGIGPLRFPVPTINQNPDFLIPRRDDDGNEDEVISFGGMQEISFKILIDRDLFYFIFFG